MNTNQRKEIEKKIEKIKKMQVLAEQGCTSEVRKVEADNVYLLKSSFKQRDREWLKEEAFVLQKLKHNHLIPVPRYVYFGGDQDVSHLLMSFEQGVSLTAALKSAENMEEKKRLIKDFGALLQRLHEIDLLESFNHQGDWLSIQLNKAEGYMKQGQTDSDLQLLENLKENKPSPVKQTMIHGDCTTDNVLVTDGKVSLFIDVSRMTVGDPRYDESLAIRKWIQHEALLNAFYEGYHRYRVSESEFRYFENGLYEFF
nr:aminoglycoside phosphotransferase APH(3') [Oceanobacillus jeddahense]